MNHKPMLNAYPDSLGGNLGDIVTLLKTEAMQDVFSSLMSSLPTGKTLTS